MEGQLKADFQHACKEASKEKDQKDAEETLWFNGYIKGYQTCLLYNENKVVEALHHILEVYLPERFPRIKPRIERFLKVTDVDTLVSIFNYAHSSKELWEFDENIKFISRQIEYYTACDSE